VFSALGLTACSDSSSGLSALISGDSVAPVAAKGESCDGIHGDPPRHVTWPYLWNDRMFAFLRDHPLP
jgi:hypothetical protein